MKKLTIILMLLITSNITLAGEIDRIAQELNWENKWNKVTSRAIASYLERVRSEQMKGLTENQKVQASKEISNNMANKFHWDNSGESFLKNMTAACDLNVLKNLVSLKNGTHSNNIDKDKVVADYQACMTVGFKKAMKILQDATISFESDKNKIIENLRNKKQ